LKEQKRPQVRRLHCGYTVTHSKIPYRSIASVPPDAREDKRGSALLNQGIRPAIPNALLARYFQARGLFGDLDFSALKETQPDAVCGVAVPA
jgi:hypothetical protein